MLSHNTIWSAIDRLASQKNLSPSGLARLAGLDSTSFNPSKRVKPNGRPRWPSTESIAKILSATETSAESFFRKDLANEAPDTEPDAWLCSDILTQKPASHWPNTQCTDKTPSEAQQIFTLQVKGTHFMPFYQNGAHLLLSCNSEHQVGHRVIVKSNPTDFLLGDVEQFTPISLQLCALSKERTTQTISLSCVEWVARILWASQ